MASSSATVVALASDDGEGSQSVTLETSQGGRVTAFAYGESFVQGEVVEISLEPLEVDGEFEDVFSGNSHRESAFEPLGDPWAYLAKGQVIALEAGTMLVDCAGFIVHLDGMTNDTRVIGEWIAFRVSRMDVVRAE